MALAGPRESAVRPLILSPHWLHASHPATPAPAGLSLSSPWDSSPLLPRLSWPHGHRFPPAESLLAVRTIQMLGLCTTQTRQSLSLSLETGVCSAPCASMPSRGSGGRNNPPAHQCPRSWQCTPHIQHLPETRKPILIIHRSGASELTYLLKFTCCPQINNCGTWVVICGRAQGREESERQHTRS